jgi:hypothetical protein
MKSPPTSLAITRTVQGVVGSSPIEDPDAKLRWRGASSPGRGMVSERRGS